MIFINDLNSEHKFLHNILKIFVKKLFLMHQFLLSNKIILRVSNIAKIGIENF